MKYILGFLTVAFSYNLYAQTIFTAGNTTVTKEEFVRAFGKNNTANDKSEKAFRTYLDLYIKFKLKVKEAYEKKLDTLPNQKTELENFKSQVAESYMNDESSLQALVDEAFARSQQDIRLSHIFIPLNKGADTTAAFKKATEAYKKLQAGADFAETALAYSSDPAVKNNQGDIGFVTVFKLPYDLENIAYATPLGKISILYRSKMGYHIFKKTAERAAAGKLKAAQILLALPPDASDATKAAIKNRADSLYKLLQKGAAIAPLALKFSSDNISYQNGGIMPDIAVGHFTPAFENAVFALTKDGAVAPPIFTPYGYHLVQRLGQIPVNNNKSNAEAMQLLKQLVQADSRIQLTKQIFAKKMMAQVKYKKENYNAKALQVFADSTLAGKKTPQLPALNNKTILFSLPNQKVSAVEFSQYLQSIRNAPPFFQNKSAAQLQEQYAETVATTYYKNNLEQHNSAFANQLAEFKEGNLLFEVMQREVWEKAPVDTNGLKKYYTENKNKYWWESSADAILFTCTDSTLAASTKAAFLKNKKNWRSLISTADAAVQADSGRYEITQLPISNPSLAKEGYISNPSKLVNDNITNFVYVLKVYTQKTPRSFEEAKGFVINDYQQLLEEKWVQQLKTRYPVKINESALQSCWK
jgi:peptidyl-prolyl cis-trans isomerase SurA